MEWTDPRDMDEDEYAEYLREEKTRDHVSAHNAVLEKWLEQQCTGFSAWAKERAGRGPWDFTVDSLPRLEALIRDAFDSPAQARKVTDTPLVAVAAWYLGEVHNRAFGTQWQLHPSFADDNPLDHRPHITLPWERREEFHYTDPEHIEDDARPIYSPTEILCNLPARPADQGLLHRISSRWEVPTSCDDSSCRYHPNS
ncbi:hypothetical protein G7Z12_33290 [Streptomyces sp. ID38640]|uniref:hypothetical protein n=1 Tax=Streptomyces sp. ID38640 TaxID=1265399 RepID=UPI00140EF014|nr:hypothetical protein [Streptomyces sp. ID38640]QIK10212.1 hypothetical protein G7Z12_33290 [Streptomyces sp. ID38640]